MKKIFYFIVLFLNFQFSFAQELKMTFEPLVRDLIARTQSRVDLNGQPCAVIRVSAANVGDFVFEGNIIGEVMYSQGEALIYMPQGSRRLKIKNDEYGTVGYEFPEKLEKQMTYELRIDPLKKNPFSQEALAEAERVINRYWEVTGLKEIKDKNILPSFSMKNDVRISYEGDTLVYETQMMFDISSKKMFMQEYGQACGRNGDKYWAGLIGEEVRLTEKSEPFKRNKITRMLQLPLTKVKEVYEGMQKPFGLDMFDVENSSWVYTIGENKLENGKRYIGIYKRSKTTEFAVKVIYMDSETGLVYQIADYTDNSLTEFLEYQEIDGILLCKTVRQTRDGAEMLTQVKEVNLNILFDESLLKKKVIVKSSDISEAKKNRKKRLLGNFVEGLTLGIVSHQEKASKWSKIVASFSKGPTLIDNWDEIYYE